MAARQRPLPRRRTRPLFAGGLCHVSVRGTTRLWLLVRRVGFLQWSTGVPGWMNWRFLTGWVVVLSKETVAVLLLLSPRARLLSFCLYANPMLTHWGYMLSPHSRLR